MLRFAYFMTTDIIQEPGATRVSACIDLPVSPGHYEPHGLFDTVVYG